MMAPCWLTVLLLLWLLTGCGEAPSRKPAAPKASPPPVVKPVESKAVPSQGPLIPPVSLVEKSGPSYNPEGKPDPFQPLRSEDEFKKERLGKILPLQRFELSEFELVGILSLSGGRKAVVQDMTGRGYTVQVGTRIGKKEGKVTRIDPKEAVIEEPFQDYLGRVKTRRVSLKLPQANE